MKHLIILVQGDDASLNQRALDAATAAAVGEGVELLQAYVADYQAVARVGPVQHEDHPMVAKQLDPDGT